MKILSSMYGSVKSAPRKLLKMVFGRGSALRIFFQPGSSRDYHSAVGDGTGSSTVMAPIQWAARTFPEAPIALARLDDAGQEEQILTRDSGFLKLMRRPNPFYSGPILLQATLIDWLVDGNGYWIKIRDRGGRVVEYWWAPSWTIAPKGDDTEFITHYEYSPGGGEPFSLPNNDIIHFRFGLDGNDPRKGRAPLKSVLREIYTDDEAANFTASLLHNMGVPGLLVSPDSDKPISPEDAKAAKAYIKESFTGDARGNALVMTGKTKLEQFGFSPEQLLLKDLRRIPEERVSAVTGIPAVVAGLGAGLDRSTFNNFAEARVAAYEQALIPTQTLWAEDLWFQSLPDFVGADELWNYRVYFDLSKVRCLQEDQNKMANRMAIAMRSGIAKRSEGRRALGLKVTPEDEVYLIPMNMAIVPSDGSEPKLLTSKKNTGTDSTE